MELLLERLGRVSPNALARGAGRLFVSERPPTAAGCWVTLEQAVRAVLLPVHVLVENVINDRAFLARAMPPAWRARLDAWERAGWLRYENGGGIATMRTIVERHADDAYARQAFGLPSSLWSLVHVIVFDHDGNDAEHPSGDSQRLERAGRDAGLGDRSHRLRRRDQEHYLPREAVEALVASQSPANERDQHTAQVAAHWARGEGRHFTPLHLLRKNAFGQPLAWPDEWFERDGSSAEMRLLAEKIAAAI